MCLAAEIRINRSDGAYTGTSEELQLLSEFIQHLLVHHEPAFNVDVSIGGYLNMYLSNPLEMHAK